jgi:thiamine biosynthesis lipoprotein ApbE
VTEAAVTTQPDGPRIPTRDPGRRRAERVMGTVISLVAPDGGADSSTADRAFAWLHEVDRRFSPFRPDSEVSRLMRAPTIEPASLSPELAEVLERCAVVEDLSAGAFDIRRHRADGAPDPTGVVKGWAVDRAGAIMEEAGLTRFCFAAGGDVLARGGRAPGLPSPIPRCGPRSPSPSRPTIWPWPPRAARSAASTSWTAAPASGHVSC